MPTPTEMTSAPSVTAPSVATATKTAKGTLKITFSPPATNGAPILHDTATCTSSNGGVAKTATSKASPIVVTGLTAGKIYACMVSATNARGTGPASPSSLPRTV